MICSDKDFPFYSMNPLFIIAERKEKTLINDYRKIGAFIPGEVLIIRSYIPDKQRLP